MKNRGSTLFFIVGQKSLQLRLRLSVFLRDMQNRNPYSLVEVNQLPNRGAVNMIRPVGAPEVQKVTNTCFLAPPNAVSRIS